METFKGIQTIIYLNKKTGGIKMMEPITNSNSEFISVNESLPRQTSSGGTSFKEIMKEGGEALLEILPQTSKILPDGGLLAASVRAGTHIISGVIPENSGETLDEGTNISHGSEFSEFWKMQKEGQLMNLEFLKIQEALSRENRVFSTISNVLKARHETVRNAINNIR